MAALPDPPSIDWGSEEAVVRLTQELIKIRSQNKVDPEDAVGDYIKRLLIDFLPFAPYSLKMQQLSPGRTNLIAVFEPSFDARLILFSGHQDTVVGYESNHSEAPRIENGKIFGRGACDMKGPIAAILVAVYRWLKANFPRLIQEKKGIAVAFTVDEEASCGGMYALDSPEIKSVLNRADLCILGEPSSLTPVIGHKGINWYDVKFLGKAAHASVPELGQNAIYAAAQFIRQIELYYHDLQQIKTPLGTPKINVGLIQGGQATNIVPNECQLSIDRRFVTGENVDEELSKIQIIAQKNDPTAEVQAKKPGYPYLLPQAEANPWYLRIAPSCKKGFDLTLPAYTEADMYYRVYGVPTLIIGPGSIAQAHQTPEFIEISELHDAVSIYMNILTEYFKS